MEGEKFGSVCSELDFSQIAEAALELGKGSPARVKPRLLKGRKATRRKKEAEEER